MPEVDLKHVGVVVLNWNGLNNTLHCLESLLELPQTPAEILVIDNGSTPAQDQDLQRFAQGPIRILRLEENLGFAGGCNLGITQLLRRPEIQYVLLLNNDTTVTPGAIPALLAAVQQPQVGLVGARMLRMDQPEKIENSGLGLSSWGLAWNITNDQAKTSLASGGCLLLSRAMIEEVSLQENLFDPKLFLYVEDVDLGLRALAQGWKSVTADDAVVYHVGSASTKQHPDMALYYWHRNTLWVMWKNFPSVTLWLNFLPVFFLHLGIGLIYTLKGRGGVVWKAKWDAIKGLHRVIRQRHERKSKLKYRPFRAILYSNWKAIRAWQAASH